MNDLDIRMTAADSAKFLGVSLQFIHKQLKLKKLESFKSQNRVYFGHSYPYSTISIPALPVTLLITCE